MYDLVIKNGRVIDPESRFDKVTNLGIISGKIQLISDEEILGEKDNVITNRRRNGNASCTPFCRC